MGGESNINRVSLILPSYASCVCLSSFLPTLKFINMGNTDLIGCNTSILEIRLLLSTTCSGTNPGSSLPVHSASPSASLKPHKTTYGNKSFRKVISRIMSNCFMARATAGKDRTPWRPWELWMSAGMFPHGRDYRIGEGSQVICSSFTWSCILHMLWSNVPFSWDRLCSAEAHLM